MWLLNVYSEGDLLHDEYLHGETRIEKDEEGSNFQIIDPKYQSHFDISSRLDYLTSCIERLQAEQDFLIKNGGRLIGHVSYEDVNWD